MDRWPGDILHAPALGGRAAYLHAFLDDAIVLPADGSPHSQPRDLIAALSGEQSGQRSARTSSAG
jgi:hypothetical protein